MSAVARVYVALAMAAALAVVTMGRVVLSRRAPTPSLSDGGAPSESADDVWCADGLAKIEGGGCFAPPSAAGGNGAPIPLLVYLRAPRSPSPSRQAATHRAA